MSHRRHHVHHRGCTPLCTSVRHELLDLANHLRQERLYVQHEKVQLQKLNSKVKTSSEKLSHVAWIAHQQRENLNSLIFSTRGFDASPARCCFRANVLEQTVFQDAYKHLGHQEVIYSEFLRTIRHNTKFMAKALAVGDKLCLSKMPNIVSTVFSGIYGSCLMHDDEVILLRLLKHLMKIQLTSAQNPRKLLRQGNCAFSRLYKSLSEELFSAKLFLTSALYEPILGLLSDDEIYLDIDPSKTVIRYSPSERLNKFGREGTADYEKNVQQHRLYIVSKLESLTNSFIQGIRDNLHCFPPALARLLRTMYRLLMSSGHAEPREVNAVCVDVIFYLFICPAMVDPNPVGIIDTPISYIARSNLMQVAQILQVLAMWKWEEIDPRLLDLYSRFDKETMSSVLETLLESANDLGTSDDDDDDEFITEDQGTPNSLPENLTSDLSSSPRLSRMSILLTKSQLNELVTFLRNVRDVSSANLVATNDDIDVEELNRILGPIPESVPGFQKKQSFKPSSSTPVKNVLSKTDSLKSPRSDESLVSLAAAKKQLLTNKLSTVATTVSSKASALSSNMRSSSSLPISPDEDQLEPLSTSVPNVRLDESRADAVRVDQEPEVVMVIPIHENRCLEPPGFLSEDQVISQSRQSSGNRTVRMNLANLPGEEEGGHSRGAGLAGNSEENSSLVSGGAGEKRTRFSLSHDDGSIGNTSDNLEAISEAASNHSVDSSLEDEDDPVEDPIIDNLSDMVSANVSGRGTPNVSGRDTPSSQVTEGDEVGGGGDGGVGQIGSKRNNNDPPRARVSVDESAEQDQPQRDGDEQDGDREQEHRAARRPDGGQGQGPSGRKNGEPDLEEKFGRFEIKPPTSSGGSTGHNLSLVGAAGSEQGDETISMVSDTWSTDVLASDTETIGEGDHLTLLLHQRRQPRGMLGGPSIGLQMDAGSASRNLLDDLIESPTQSVGRQRGATLSRNVDGSRGSLGSASTGNLLDVSETGSEAWSMDVMASDTESIRLAELDNEDSASVARSDDTRFTDDTTRSDPEPLVDLSGGPHASAPTRGIAHGSVSHRYRRDDVTSVRRGFSSDGGHLLRPSREAAVEQWARQSSGPRANLISRRGSESSGGRFMTAQDTIFKSKHGDADTMTRDILASRSSDGGTSSVMTSHLSAASIASSTESSAGESATGFSVTTVSAALTATTEPSSTLEIDIGSAGGSRVDDDSGLRCLIDGEVEVATAGPSETQPSTAPILQKSVSQDDQSANKGAIPKMTGAIPKSISFDKNVRGNGPPNRQQPNIPPSPTLFGDWAEGDQSGTNMSQKFKKRDNSFFKSWKLPKIGRSKLPGGQQIPVQGINSQQSLTSAEVKRIMTSEYQSSGLEDQASASGQIDLLSEPVVETSDDILAKYRGKRSAGNPLQDLSNSNDVILHEGNRAQDETDYANEDDNRLVIDPRNIEASFAFQDAKRKLRMMLAEADLNMLSSLPMTSSSSGSKSRTNDLIWLLRVQLAEAHNLQDRNLVAQLHETLRCLSLFDAEGCRKLVRSLREDYKRRSPYLSYLVRCRQGLLSTLAHQERVLSRMEIDARVCLSHLISVVVRMFLERREKELADFVSEFKVSSAADEKIALMERFMAELWAQLESDSSTMLWSLMVTEDQQDLCRLTVERSVVAQIYVFAMFPNGEADISRDEVLSLHIRRLSPEITPGHRDLRIPRQYHYEQPWPSAQAEIRRLAAYKTPQDKVACVVRCSKTIMNLLSISSTKSVPAADDFIPVMVFVIIKANPPSLLSTVQYVDSFYGNRLCGEEQYWWMQFASAIEFIKTMDYQSQ